MSRSSDIILSVEDLRTYFPVRSKLLRTSRRFVRAVDGVNLSVRRGQTLGLVGESGSGKTTAGRTILGLIKPTTGRVIFDGNDISHLSRRRFQTIRRRMQIIFQDPVSSLNPRMTVGDIVAEPLAVHRIVPRRDRPRRVAKLLEQVGLAEQYANRYPHEFSGGQRQRIGIARALASEPELIIADEPVSALDVSVAAQILNLLKDLQERLGLSYLLIAHNLAVVEHFADKVAVMYLGRIVEQADSDALYARPTHPYTQALLSAVPKPVPGGGGGRIRLAGDPPSPIDPPTGCPFHTRCPLTRQLAEDAPDSDVHRLLSEGRTVSVIRRCAEQIPQLKSVKTDPSHLHACLLRQGE